MNVTLREIRIGLAPMDTLAKSDAPSAKTRYRIGKLLGKMGKEYEAMEKQFSKLREQHGTPNAEGAYVVLPNTQAYKDFVAKVDELLDMTVELTGVDPISIDDIPDAVKLSSGDMYLLGPFLADSAEPAAA